jgi:hypothetical protein
MRPSLMNPAANLPRNHPDFFDEPPPVCSDGESSWMRLPFLGSGLRSRARLLTLGHRENRRTLAGNRWFRALGLCFRSRDNGLTVSAASGLNRRASSWALTRLSARIPAYRGISVPIRDSASPPDWGHTPHQKAKSEEDEDSSQPVSHPGGRRFESARCVLRKTKTETDALLPSRKRPLLALVARRPFRRPRRQELGGEGEALGAGGFGHSDREAEFALAALLECHQGFAAEFHLHQGGGAGG